MMAVVTMLMTLAMVHPSTLATYSGCINSCCQQCATPDHCDACYRVNTNPSMCPCVGEEDIFVSANQQRIVESRSSFERLVIAEEPEEQKLTLTQPEKERAPSLLRIPSSLKSGSKAN